MIDHVSVLVSDYQRARDAYLAALAPLGYGLIMELTREQIPVLPASHLGGLGAGGKPDLWLRAAQGKFVPSHVALSGTRAQVDAFWHAALKAGLQPNGGPGVRAHYHPHYYGAFVLDADGNNLEVVCHAPA